MIMIDSDLRHKLQLTPEENREEIFETYFVYHRTGKELVQKILAEGLKPNPTFKNRIDDVIDQFAPSCFSRTNAVFAYPELDHKLNNYGSLSTKHPWVYIQVEVNPALVFVANKYLYTLIVFAKTMKDNAEVERLARLYWESGMVLGDYLKLNPTDPRRFASPEALIPGGALPKRLSLLES